MRYRDNSAAARTAIDALFAFDFEFHGGAAKFPAVVFVVSDAPTFGAHFGRGNPGPPAPKDVGDRRGGRTAKGATPPFDRPGARPAITPALGSRRRPPQSCSPSSRRARRSRSELARGELRKDVRHAPDVGERAHAVGRGDDAGGPLVELGGV